MRRRWLPFSVAPYKKEKEKKKTCINSTSCIETFCGQEGPMPVAFRHCMADGQDCLRFILRSYEILDGVFG
jgi:hypothetical protein